MPADCVCFQVQRVHEDFCVKIVSVSHSGSSILRDDEDGVPLSKSASLRHIPNGLTVGAMD
jgi:hypothetical protein